MSNGKTIGGLLAEARRQLEAPNLAGHDLMDLARFSENTRHMIVFDVLSDASPVGNAGEHMRLFLSDTGYVSAQAAQERGEIKIRSYARVNAGNLHYDEKGRDL